MKPGLPPLLLPLPPMPVVVEGRGVISEVLLGMAEVILRIELEVDE